MDWTISIRLIFAICRTICVVDIEGVKALCQVSLQKLLGVYVVGGLPAVQKANTVTGSRPGKLRFVRLSCGGTGSLPSLARRCYIRSMCARDYKGWNAEPRL